MMYEGYMITTKNEWEAFKILCGIFSVDVNTAMIELNVHLSDDLIDTIIT